MRSQIKLVRLFGVELGLHYSWLIIAVLIVFSLGGYFQQVHPGWSSGVVWSISVATGVLFFVFLFAHELSHALVAKARGLPVHKITLFALGGMAQIEKEPERASTEFWMGIVGPITSFVIGVVLLAVASALGWRWSWSWSSEAHAPGVAMLVWLGRINIALAVFNMIPGFPLDGGRVLRAIIWGITKSADRSTQIAARIGQLVGIGFILYGILEFFHNEAFGGLWLAFIGWFLMNAAGASYMQLKASNALAGVSVGQVMSQDCQEVEGHISLQDFVDHFLLRTGRRCFLVVDNGRPLGLITPVEVRQVPREDWAVTSVQAAMKPLERIHSVTPETPVMNAMEVMAREDVNQLPVVSDGHLAGILSRAHVLELLRARSEMGSR
ncbi:MAG TPA: site-2 protease family protein [Terriglobales bacterium]|nr:site-2 protease family protein [Terriglobales bacterium]